MIHIITRTINHCKCSIITASTVILQDNLSEYVNMLSYLDPNHNILNNNLSKSDMLAHCKEKLGHHLAYERKDETSKVMEYWVPARFSKVQLELYCSTLLSNSFALRSSSKNDQVGALRDMLISLRKVKLTSLLFYKHNSNSNLNLRSCYSFAFDVLCLLLYATVCAYD